jgi:hypothetical protein
MLYPMLVMIILTFGVGFYLMVLRFRAVKQREVSIGYFRVYTGAEPPMQLVQAARHYSNLFEVPLLFYVAGVTAMLLGYQTTLMLGLAWLFVALRLVHTAIHLTYNNVVHRLGAFLLSFLCVLAMWGLLAFHYGAR